MLRSYVEGDLDAVVNCFARSVGTIGGRHYAPEQVAAWAPEHPDMKGWAERLRSGGVFVAEVNGQVVGFARADESGIVDLLYVDPEYARRGLGRELLTAACSWAVDRGARRLESEVSIVARPLFEAMGFCVEREQTVVRRGVKLRNFHMIRNADAEQTDAPDCR